MRASTALLLMVTAAGSAMAQDVAWRPSISPASGRPLVKLCRPEPFVAPSAPAGATPVSAAPVRLGPIVRGQSPDPLPPPPPPPPGAMVPGAPMLVGPEEAYNCGVVNTDGGTGGWWQRFCDGTRQCCDDVFGSFRGMFSPAAGRSLFQSEQCFTSMISPVTQPFLFEDPRALTELRPIFIWQRTPSSNEVFAGGNNYFAGLQARLALTERVSVVVNKVGWNWIDPENPAANPAFTSDDGFSELWVGPKFTIIRNDLSNSVVAIGATFEIPIGDSAVFQNTGTLGLAPYISWSQGFGKFRYGSFNFIANGGYSLGFDDDRNEFAFANLHLSFDVLDLKKFYPLIELNWAYYTQNGNLPNTNFGGWDLYNFGSDNVSGLQELVISGGFRYKVSENIQFGIAAGANVLGGSRHLDAVRVTADMIFRY